MDLSYVILLALSTIANAAIPNSYITITGPKLSPFTATTSYSYTLATPIPDVPASGSDFAYISACSSAHVQWSSALTSFAALHSTAFNYSSWTTTQIQTFLKPVYTNPPIAISTGCDGIPRMQAPAHDVSPNASTSLSQIENTFAYQTTSFDPLATSYFPVSKPECTIPQQQCRSMWDTYSASSVYLKHAWSDIRATQTTELSFPTSPPCFQELVQPYTNATAYEMGCHVAVDEVRLMYWPVTVVGDLCHWNRTTIAPTPTTSGVVTAVINSTTFTSPSIYISVKNAYAFTPSNGQMGSITHSTMLVSIHPTALSSGRGFKNMYPYSFDLADIQGDMPWAAYAAMRTCSAGIDCYEMWESDYRPNIMLPTEVLDAEPAWASCTPNQFGAWDPPIVIRPTPLTVDSLFPQDGPTSNPQPAPTAADPAPAPTSAQTAVDPTTTASTPDLAGGAASPSDFVNALASMIGELAGASSSSFTAFFSETTQPNLDPAAVPASTVGSTSSSNTAFNEGFGMGDPVPGAGISTASTLLQAPSVASQVPSDMSFSSTSPSLSATGLTSIPVDASSHKVPSVVTVPSSSQTVPSVVILPPDCNESHSSSLNKTGLSYTRPSITSGSMLTTPKWELSSSSRTVSSSFTGAESTTSVAGTAQPSTPPANTADIISWASTKTEYLLSCWVLIFSSLYF